MDMKFELDEYHRGISDDELIAELKRVASLLNKTALNRTDNDDHGKYGTTTYIRRFGSWFNALEKAGLEKTRTPMNLPEEELFKNLEEVWIKLGRQPRYAEVQKPLSKYHVGTASSEAAIANVEVEPSTRHKTKRGINWRLRFIVMRRDNFRCKNCGRSPATDPTIILHVDHIMAWVNGRETVFENLQTLCSKCNIGKSDLEAFE
jgi:hypothetical protein